MKNLRLRALVLTAGLGQRLRPLTLFLPKALLPVCGEPVVGHSLECLVRSGCEAVTLNTHHLAESIPRVFGERYRGLPVSYSVERELQGTLGALFPLKKSLAEADLVILLNGDSLCLWPLQKMIKHHLRSRAEATLLLHRRSHDELLGGGVGVGPDGDVVQLRDAAPTREVARRHIFMGAHILSPHLLEHIQRGPADIVGDLYIPLLKEGRRIRGVVTSRRWHDLGTPARYLSGCLDWARNYSGRAPSLRPWNMIADKAQVADSAEIQHSVIEMDTVVAAHARIEESVLLPGVRVPEGCTVRRSLVGPAVELPAGSDIERRMVTSIRSGYQPSALDSVMGGLIYTPLGPV